MRWSYDLNDLTLPDAPSSCWWRLAWTKSWSGRSVEARLRRDSSLTRWPGPEMMSSFKERLNHCKTFVQFEILVSCHNSFNFNILLNTLVKLLSNGQRRLQFLHKLKLSVIGMSNQIWSQQFRSHTVVSATRHNLQIDPDCELAPPASADLMMWRLDVVVVSVTAVWLRCLWRLGDEGATLTDIDADAEDEFEGKWWPIRRTATE